MILDPAQRKLVRWHNIIRAHIFGLTARFLLQEIKMKEEIIDCMLNGGLLLILWQLFLVFRELLPKALSSLQPIIKTAVDRLIFLMLIFF